MAIELNWFIFVSYSYFLEHLNRSLLIVLLLLVQVVPHGTKGTGPRFITRPVCLRSLYRYNSNLLSFGRYIYIYLLYGLYINHSGESFLGTPDHKWLGSLVCSNVECYGRARSCYQGTNICVQELVLTKKLFKNKIFILVLHLFGCFVSHMPHFTYLLDISFNLQ